MPELNLGRVVGPQGPQGVPGPAGAQGAQGIQGPAGEAGKSAYRAARDGGYTGTEAEFNAILAIIEKHAGRHRTGGADPLTPWDIGAASGNNLLDNWYFHDPINQRGQTEYTAGQALLYTIDRWLLQNGTLTVNDGYVTFGTANSDKACIFLQRLPLELGLAGKQVTLSFMTKTGLYYLTAEFKPSAEADVYHLTIDGVNMKLEFLKTDEFYQFYIRKDIVPFYLDLVAVKLELGSTQTLAHQDADGNWVLNDPPPNKALELFKCQRYYRRSWIGPDYSRLFAHSFIMQGNGNNTRPVVRWDTPMRAAPDVILYGPNGEQNAIWRYSDNKAYVGLGTQYHTPYSFFISGFSDIWGDIQENIGSTMCFNYEASADL